MGNLSSGCGCGNSRMSNGSDCCSIIWILILLSIFCNNGSGSSLFGGGCGCDDDCGNNSCIWLILLLLFCGNGSGFGFNNGCGCGSTWNNGCGDNCGC